MTQPERFTRTVRLEALEVRDTGEGRTLDVRAVPYNSTISVGGYRERFMHGAFRSFVAASKGVRLFWDHDQRAFPIGRSLAFDEKRDGLYGSFMLSRSARGEEALTLVEEGILDSVSIGFENIRSRRSQDGVVERLKSWLHELSLVDAPAYEDAKVLAVRKQQDMAEMEQHKKWQEWVGSLRA